MSTDRIEKKVVINAPQPRVWEAISDSREFGSWFGMKLDGPFVPGAHMNAVIVPTTVDAEVAEEQKAYEGVEFILMIERVEPQSLFSFRWHPYALDEGTDYRTAPSTLVSFALEPLPQGTLLTVTESGFDQIPLDRRAKAFASNEQGWAVQIQLIQKYLS